MRQRNLIGAIVLIAVIIVGVVFFTRYSGSSSPAAEAAFIAGIDPIMAQVSVPNADLPGWRRKRAAMICQTIPNLAVTDWIGTVDKTDTSITGGAVLAIAVAPNVDFGTAPNALSNITSNTLISPNTPLYQTITGLQVGEKVRFSGQLFSSSTDCIEEASVTDQGSMQNPLFITRFIGITPLTSGD